MAEKKGSRSIKSAKMIRAEIEFAKKQYEKKIQIKPGETKEQWEKRTESIRLKHEDSINKLNYKLNNKGKAYVHKIGKKKQYALNKGIEIQITKRPADFLKNTLLVLTWTEVKYKMDKELILFIINLYNRETFFTEEEIVYLASLHNLKFRSINKFVEEGVLEKYVDGTRGGANKKELDVYVLTIKATRICTKIYKAIIGAEKLGKLLGSNPKHKEVNKAVEEMSKDILDIKSGFKE